jgi:hypothetical protein
MIGNEYELAQKRIQAWRRKRNDTIALVVFIALVSAVCLLAGNSAFVCGLPFILLAGLFALSNVIELYYHAHAPSEADMAQEMVWLFGDDWREMTGAQEYALAQDRIRERRIGRWVLPVHIALYTLAAGVILLPIRPMPPLVYGLFGLWLIGLFFHARHTFPSLENLARRERKAGEAIRRELELLTPEKRKHEEKPKRAYALGDDGEIVELMNEDVIDELDRREKGKLA